MTPALPDSPQHAVHAAMAATGRIAALTSIHWTRGNTSIGGLKLLLPRAEAGDAKAALHAALTPWFDQIADIFPGLSIQSVIVASSHPIKLGHEPGRDIDRDGFGAALFLYGARVVRRLLEQPCLQGAIDADLAIDVLGLTGPGIIISGRPPTRFFNVSDIAEAARGWPHAKMCATWMRGIECFRINLAVPGLSAHRRAAILRLVDERTDGRP